MRTLLKYFLIAASLMPALAQTAPSAAAGALQPLPTRIVYREVFRHVVFVDELAANAQQRGKDSTDLERFYEKHAKLTAPEAAALKQASRLVDIALKRLDVEIKTEVLKYRAQVPRGRITAATKLPPLPVSLVELQIQKDNAILEQVAFLQTAMGASRFSQFDAWVQREVSRHIQVTTVPAPAPAPLTAESPAPRAAPPPPTPSLREVVCVSQIETPYNENVTTYSATDTGAEVAASYDSGVDAQMWVGGSPSEHRYYTSWLSASARMTMYAATNTIFRIETTHFLLAQFCENPEMGGCWKPLTFTNSGGSEWGYRIFSGYDNEINPYGDVPYVSLGTTKWEVDTTAPHIDGAYMCDPPGSNTPANAVLNSSGCFELRGHHLMAAGDDPQPEVIIDGTGATAYGCSGTDVRLVCGYTVSANVQPLGTHKIYVTTYAGPSSPNAGTITIGDPTPMIESVTPSTWSAGQQYSCSIQIVGTGFGANLSFALQGHFA